MKGFNKYEFEISKQNLIKDMFISKLLIILLLH